jgi:hypothetical protein
MAPAGGYGHLRVEARAPRAVSVLAPAPLHAQQAKLHSQTIRTNSEKKGGGGRWLFLAVTAWSRPVCAARLNGARSSSVDENAMAARGGPPAPPPSPLAVIWWQSERSAMAEEKARRRRRKSVELASGIFQ